ncbi:unnamed protein product [Urochloa decumbens]|uniref:Uncharacterized protein n=1 Tax=Urochloa decumbens TaxID=240449 RepID=A0ABC9DQF2_9POAL
MGCFAASPQHSPKTPAAARRRRHAMNHLRNRLSPFLSTRRSLPTTRAPLLLLSLHRLLSATAASPSPKPFAIDEYLVSTCGLTRAQALKASKKLAHLRSSSKPDAVLAFLSALGLSRPDIAGLVAADPCFLCASVENTLAPRITELSDLGLSRAQIARLVPLAPSAPAPSAPTSASGSWSWAPLRRDVGLEIPYIAQRPVLIMYSLEGRLIPRHQLIKLLSAKGLLSDKFDLYSVFAFSEKKFLDKFMHPYKHTVPGLADAYASSCAGKVAHGTRGSAEVLLGACQ